MALCIPLACLCNSLRTPTLAPSTTFTTLAPAAFLFGIRRPASSSSSCDSHLRAMSEFLGSAFRSFVDHRKVSTALELPPSHKRPRDGLALTPLRIPHPPHKKLRYNELPTGLVPDSFAPGALVSPVSILPSPGFPAAQSASYVQPQLSPVSQSTSQFTAASHGFTPSAYDTTENIRNSHVQPSLFEKRPVEPQEGIPSYFSDTTTLSRPSAVHDLINVTPHSPLKRPRDPTAAPLYRTDPDPSQSSNGHENSAATVVQDVKSGVHERRNWECNHCKAEYPTRNTLLMHIKDAHQRPFACKVAGCTACFSKQNHLSRHVRIVHNKERPFACTEPGCGSRFGSKSHLGDHTRAVHMRVRDFECHICGASWSKRFNLEKHIRIRHLGEKPFKCGMCNLSFGTRSHVTRHEMKVHKKGDIRVGEVGNHR